MNKKIPQQLIVDAPVCPIYEEEQKRPRWRELQNEYYIVDPGCGHAINYLVWNTNSTIKPSSASTYSTHLYQFVDFLHSMGVTVCSAELEHVQQFFKYLSDNGKREGTLSLHKTSITNLYRHVDIHLGHEPNLRWDYIREFIKPSQFRTPPPIEREPISKEEIILLIENLNTQRERLVVQIALEAGLRNSDIRGLKINDIKLEEKYLDFYNRKSNIWQRMPISGELALLLRHWLYVGRESTLVDPENDHLFPGQKHEQLSGGYLNSIVTEAAERAGIQEVIGKIKITERQKVSMKTDKEYREMHKVTLHSLRHTFNQLLKDAGVPSDFRSAALGHSSPEITKKYYEHDDDNYDEVIGELFRGLQLGI
ncbi:tyrosine-type recombinase/integrase [Haloferax sp. YSSS75]|uniref:tyrosine-type recombinase/integrase n=1 Tax=Haloferax sp. YSSS75 TaxID=3388564 RepID=UPI00398CB766